MRDVGYTLEKINPLPEFDHVQVYGLNNLGHVVGDSYTLLAAHGLGVGRAFLWLSGYPPEELRAFGEKSRALAINDLGDVVGWVEEAQRTGLGEDDEEHVLVPVMWVGDRQQIPQWFPLRLPGSPGDSAEVINNRREVLGTRGAHWSVSGKTMKHHKLPLPPMPKGHRFKPTGINNEGTIVGYSYRSVQSTISIEIENQAWLCFRGRWNKLSPDAKTSAALGLNDRNEIVGWIAPKDEKHFPMLWRETKPYPLSEEEGEAKAINAQGAIVGYTKQENRWWASLWRDGKPSLLETLLSTGTKLSLGDAIAINDKGQILANAGYLLTPTS